jgi:hypothetical protein
MTINIKDYLAENIHEGLNYLGAKVRQEGILIPADEHLTDKQLAHAYLDQTDGASAEYEAGYVYALLEVQRILEGK